MKKLLPLALITTIISTFHTTARADDFVIKPSGGFDFQMGAYDSKGVLDSARVPKDKRNMTANQKSFAFNSTGYLNIKAENTTEEGLKYGVSLGLNTTARSMKKGPSCLYIESDAGKLELGTEKTANTKMKAPGYSNSWDMWMSADPADKKIQYISSFSSFLDSKTRNTDQIEFSRKVTYYSPELKGFNFGISYVPDSTNVGYNSLGKAAWNDPIKNDFYDLAFKNAFAWGISHKAELAEGVKLETSLTGEHGKTVKKLKEKDDKKTAQQPTPAVQANVGAVNVGAGNVPPAAPQQAAQGDAPPPITKFTNLKNYTIGAKLSIDDFSIAGSYGNYFKSATSRELDKFGRKTHLYSIGAGYKFGDIGTSITHFHGNHKKNIINTTSFVVEYKWMPGLMPYTEVAYMRAHGKYTEKDGKVKRDSRKCALLLIGAKLEF